MRISIERRRRAAPQTELLEVVTPRTNAATITPAENLLAAITSPEPLSIEIAATRHTRWFLARAASAAMRSHVEEQVGAAYPQAALRPIDIGRYPHRDPARPGPHEQVAACALLLRGPRYLPIRTFGDLEVD